MQITSENPRLTPLLRILSVIEVFVLASAGIGLFFFPDFIRDQWPWMLTPFNTRFLGAVYLASMVAVAVMVFVGQPARPVLWAIFAFTLEVLIVTLIYNSRLIYERPASWLWLILYIVLPLNSGYHLWLYRKQPSYQAVDVPRPWYFLLCAVAAFLGIYGIGLLILPATFAAFWPWALDAFHSQLYSAAFITGAVGLLAVARRSSSLEFVGAGLTQAILGGFAIVGLLLVDASVHRVNWSAAGTWLWLAMFAVLLFVGGAMVTAGMRRRNTK